MRAVRGIASTFLIDYFLYEVYISKHCLSSEQMFSTYDLRLLTHKSGLFFPTISPSAGLAPGNFCQMQCVRGKGENKRARSRK